MNESTQRAIQEAYGAAKDALCHLSPEDEATALAGLIERLKEDSKQGKQT